uniref:Uncharacterized protein n=1 Tax=Anguilla anguilla TaxID=7936 RepID=A0A0E9TK79_ANGAN
MNPGYDFRV